MKRDIDRCCSYGWQLIVCIWLCTVLIALAREVVWMSIMEATLPNKRWFASDVSHIAIKGRCITPFQLSQCRKKTAKPWTLRIIFKKIFYLLWTVFVMTKYALTPKAHSGDSLCFAKVTYMFAQIKSRNLLHCFPSDYLHFGIIDPGNACLAILVAVFIFSIIAVLLNRWFHLFSAKRSGTSLFYISQNWTINLISFWRIHQSEPYSSLFQKTSIIAVRLLCIGPGFFLILCFLCIFLELLCKKM